MKDKIKHIIIFYILYLIVIILFALINNKIVLTIESLYNNVFLFSLYLYFSQYLIFNYNEKIKNKKEYIKITTKKILKYNFLIVIGLTIINILILSIFVKGQSFYGIMLFPLQLFLILIIISLFSILVELKNQKYNNRYILLMFIYLLYGLQNMYGDNLFLINIFKYYFGDYNILEIVIHYILWLLFPISIIYFKYLKKNKKEV